MKLFVLVLIVPVLWLLAAGANLPAQTAAPTILVNEAVVDFPRTVTFRLEVEAGTELAAASLAYSVGRLSCLEAAAQVPVAVEGSTVEWTWVMARSGNPPPGASLWWEWTLTDTAGNTLTTPRRSLTFSDDRFAWRTATAGNIHLHWYEGEDVGPILLEAAVAGLDRLQEEMGIELQENVQIFIYGDSEDMRQAVLYIQDWAGGVAFSEYNTILIGVPPDIAESWGRSTIRHELAHLVIGQFGRSCVGGSRPTWLDEGLAVYAEGSPHAEGAPDAEGPGQDAILRDIEQGVRDNTFEPLRSLSGPFPAHGPAAGIAYSQSYSVVAYLLEAYGQEKMQDLLLTLAEGAGYDEALEQVYGFNVDGLEVAWREAIGAQPRPIPPTPTAIVAANVPTVVPAAAPRSLPTAEAAAAPPPAAPSSPDLCGLGLIPVLLIGLFVGERFHKQATAEQMKSSRKDAKDAKVNLVYTDRGEHG